MKKNFLLIALLAMFTMPAFAQLDGGLKGGLNLTKLSVQNLNVDYERGAGFDIGAFARVGIGDYLYLQPELMYSFNTTRPESLDMTLFNINFDKEKMHNVDIPIYLGAKFGDKIAFRVFLGPRLGFTLNKAFGYSQIWDDFKSSHFTFAGRAGVGVDVLFMTLDVVYDYSFTKAFSIANINNLDPHLNTIKVQLGLKLF